MEDAWRWRVFRTWGGQQGQCWYLAGVVAAGLSVLALLSSWHCPSHTGEQNRRSNGRCHHCHRWMSGTQSCSHAPTRTIPPSFTLPSMFSFTAPKPYFPLYPSNVLRPFPALSLSSSLSHCSSSSSLLLNTRSCAVLADDTRFRILRFVRGHFCVRNYHA